MHKGQQWIGLIRVTKKRTEKKMRTEKKNEENREKKFLNTLNALEVPDPKPRRATAAIRVAGLLTSEKLKNDEKPRTTSLMIHVSLT